MYETGSLFSIDKEMYMLIEYSKTRRALINLKNGKRYNDASFSIDGKSTTLVDMHRLTSNNIVFITHSLKSLLDDKGKKIPAVKKIVRTSYIILRDNIRNRFPNTTYTMFESPLGGAVIRTDSTDIAEFLNSIGFENYISVGRHIEYNIPRSLLSVRIT